MFEVARAFLKLGFISFGGPLAHISYLRSEFVGKRRWLDDPAYAAVVAILLAALYNPVCQTGVHNARDVAIAVAAFACLHWWKLPPWLVVLLTATAGYIGARWPTSF